MFWVLKYQPHFCHLFFNKKQPIYDKTQSTLKIAAQKSESSDEENKQN